MRVAVIGAGVGGLSVAHGLQRAGAEVIVLDRAPRDRPQGSGLSLLPNGLTALRALGLGPATEGLTRGRGPADGGQRRPDGSWVMRVPTAALAAMRVVHRAEFATALTDALAPGTVRWECAGRLLDASAGRVAAGAEELAADLVIAADGVRSPARAALGLPTHTRYAGYGAWRGITPGPVEGVPASETWGRGLRFGLVPLPDGRVYWFAVRGGSPDEPGPHHARVLDLFGAWHSPIAEVVRATPAQDVGWTPLADLATPLPTFAVGRVALLGDAAHAMTPNLGQGANQALEDAASLVALLGGLVGQPAPDEAAVRRALAAYDALRRPRTQRIARRSRRLGAIAQARHPVGSAARDLAVRLTPDALAARAISGLAAWRPPAHPGS